MGTGLFKNERASNFAGKGGHVSFLRTPPPPQEHGSPRGLLKVLGKNIPSIVFTPRH